QGVGGGAGESGQDVAIPPQPAHLARIGLDDGVPEGDLAVPAHDDLVATADGDDGGGVEAGCLAHGRVLAGGSVDMGTPRHLASARPWSPRSEARRVGT